MRQQQKGVALVLVLLIVALVSILTTEMGARLQLQVQRALNIKDNNQAYWYAIGAEEFARKSIGTLMDESPDKIHLQQPWTQEFIYPIEGGGLSATLTDMRSCFNLNAFRQATDQQLQEQSVTLVMEAFHRMLSETGLEIDSFVLDTVRDSLADWVDSDDRMRSYGAEDSEYESREYPYLAANGLMAVQSEFRMINGVNPIWLAEILPLICVLPGDDTMNINVNTLKEEHGALLAGLTGLSLADARGVIASRPNDGWDEVADFLAEPDIAALSLGAPQTEWFKVDTDYFMLTTKTQYNKATFTMSSVFKIGDNAQIGVVRREFAGVE